MANYIVSDTDMTSVANAIRTKGGTSASLTFPGGWVTAIGNISGGGGDTWSWLGKNPTRIYQSNVLTTYFKNTDWMDWEATTTQTTLAATSVHTTFAADMTNYEYWVHTKMYEEIYYNSGATTVGRLEKACTDQWSAIVRYASNRVNLVAGTRNSNYAVSIYNQPVMDYYNASGTRTIGYSWGYGLYPGMNAPNFSSATSLSPTVNVRTPTFYARCHNTYFSVANAEYVNPNTSFYKIMYEVYRVDVGSTGLRNVQDNRMALINSGTL